MVLTSEDWEVSCSKPFSSAKYRNPLVPKMTKIQIQVDTPSILICFLVAQCC